MDVNTELKPLFGMEYSGSRPLLIAGPCSAETEARVMDTAESLHDEGVGIFRAGVWKPRTKPGGFEGMGSIALPWLAGVKRKTGMMVITEVATASHVRQVMKAGLDGVWLGARTVTNPFAVQEIADSLSEYPRERRDAFTVLVKNPVNPDLELWIGALERIYTAGISRLGAVHRGFTAYGDNLYRNPPHWRIPIELHRRLPQLPVLCDPSHIAGNRTLIESLCRQACQMKFDGFMIESHCDPDTAWSDARQQITPGKLKEIFEHLTCKVNPGQEDPALQSLRGSIDMIDNELLEVLSRRMALSREIGEYKRSHDMPVVQPGRYKKLIEERVKQGEELGMSERFMQEFLEAIHEESVRQQL